MEEKCIADDQERQTDPALTLVPGRVQALFILVLTVMKYDNFSFAQQR